MADFTFEDLGKLGDSISVQKMEGGGSVYCRLNKLYRTPEGEYKPTAKGVSVPADQVPILQEILDTFMRENPIDEVDDGTSEVSGDEIIPENPGE